MSGYLEIANYGLNMVNAAASILTLVVACFGYAAWREQLRGQSEYASARDVLLALRRLRRAYWDVRDPFIHEWEFPAEYRDKRSGEKIGDAKADAYMHVIQNRFKQFSIGEHLQTCERCVDEYCIVTDREMDGEVTALVRCMAALQYGFVELYEQLRTEDERWPEQHRTVLSKQDRAGDALGAEFERAYKAIEDEVKVRLGRFR